MKVYVLMRGYFQDWSVIGVYADKASADAAEKQLLAERETPSYDFWVDEFELQGTAIIDMHIGDVPNRWSITATTGGTCR